MKRELFASVMSETLKLNTLFLQNENHFVEIVRTSRLKMEPLSKDSLEPKKNNTILIEEAILLSILETVSAVLSVNFLELTVTKQNI